MKGWKAGKCLGWCIWGSVKIRVKAIYGLRGYGEEPGSYSQRGRGLSEGFEQWVYRMAFTGYSMWSRVDAGLEATQ